ncbi:hypothetical protein B0T18DRAFT_400927 [Schizothecium vesticola]|uniref:Ecp2 effector protein-like domain-containing protein n=1 Tax=Schizothecium vesticola TaxID=314040 RepID=A0AA40F3X9_9PEZI|nr:hypothetical protein B0T18DRAFT_400927 [Schizothecium vesticola]
MLKRQHPYQHTDSCGGSTFDNHWYSDAPWEGDCLTMIERQTTGYHSVELGWKKLLSYNTCAFSARLIDIPITDGIPLWWRNVGDDDMWDLTREGGKRGWVRDGKVAFGGVTECDEGHVEWKVHRN